jgi:hypothetical protein
MQSREWFPVACGGPLASVMPNGLGESHSGRLAGILRHGPERVMRLLPARRILGLYHGPANQMIGGVGIVRQEEAGGAPL